MQTIQILALGKCKESYLRDACREYEKRLSRFCQLQVTELEPVSLPQNPSEKEIAAALEQAKKATEMEPQNAEYAGWRQRMESGGSWYTGRQTQYGGMPVSSGSGFCWKLCLANLICNLCCGGGGLCCGGMPAGYHL